MVLETVWNCRNKLNVSKACVLMVFKTIWNFRDIDESNVSKACIVMEFETIWNCRKKLKTSMANCAL